MRLWKRDPVKNLVNNVKYAWIARGMLLMQIFTVFGEETIVFVFSVLTLLQDK